MKPQRPQRNTLCFPKEFSLYGTTNPPLPPFDKGGLGGFARGRPNMQCRLSFVVRYSSDKRRDKEVNLFGGQREENGNFSDSMKMDNFSVLAVVRFLQYTNKKGEWS